MILIGIVISSFMMFSGNCASIKLVLDGKLRTLESGITTSELTTALKQYITNPNEAIIYYKDRILDLNTKKNIEFAENDHLYVYSKPKNKSTPMMDIFSTLLSAYMTNRFDVNKINSKNKGENIESLSNDQFMEAIKDLAFSPIVKDNLMKYATPENMILLSNLLNNSKSFYDKVKNDIPRSDTSYKSTTKEDL